jgi:hypothetical protein
MHDMRFMNANLSYFRADADGSIEVCLDGEEMFWHKRFASTQLAMVELQEMAFPLPEAGRSVRVIADGDDLIRRNFIPEAGRGRRNR